MNMSKRVKGSISLLLCLVMLPLVTYSTMIIDASRLQAVRSNIAGAGELTLNAIMSDYNYLLEEMFGLFANCKSEEELRPALKAYFQQTVEGRLLPESGRSGNHVQNGIGSVVDLAFNANGDINEEDLTDFLMLQLQAADSDFFAAPVDGSALASPYTMKRQITEYMKFRGPISIASTLLGKIDYLAHAEDQVDACDKKVEYAEKLGEMQGPCLEAYEAFDKKYNMGALTLNALFGNTPTSSGNSAAVHNNSNEFDCSSETGLKKIILDCGWWYWWATRFYVMNANSPFTAGSYGDGHNFNKAIDTADIINPNYNNDYTTANSAGYDEKIRIYTGILNDLLTQATNHCGYQIDQYTLKTPANTIKVNVDRRSDVSEYLCPEMYYGHDETFNAPETADEKTPTYQQVETQDSEWRKAYKDRTAKDGFYGDQNAYAGKVFAAQRKLYDSRDNIKKMYEYHMDLYYITVQYWEALGKLRDTIRNRFYDENILNDGYLSIDGAEGTLMDKLIEKENDNNQDISIRDFLDLLDRTDAFVEEIEETVTTENEDGETVTETHTRTETTEITDAEKQNLRIAMWNHYKSRHDDFMDNVEKFDRQQHALNLGCGALDRYERAVKEMYREAIDANSCYVEYGDMSCDRGSYPLIGIGMTLDVMLKGLKTGKNHLTTILNTINGPDGLESKANAWKGSIDKVDSDSTKAAMLSDYQTSVDKFSAEEVQNLISFVDTLIAQVESELTAIKKVTYFGSSVYDGSRTENNSALKDMVKEFLLKPDTPIVDTKSDPQKHANEVLIATSFTGSQVACPPRFGGQIDKFRSSFDGVAYDNLVNEANGVVHKLLIDDGNFKPNDTETADIQSIVDAMKYFRILDGVKDDDPSAASASIYSPATASGSYSLEDNHDLLDPQEAFMITLYTEWKAAQQAQANSEANTTENQTVDQLETEALSTTAPLDTDCTTTSMSLTTADIAGIASAISSYCDVPEGSLPNGNISTNVSIQRGKDAGKSKGGGALKSCKELLAQLGNLMEKVVENVYMEEYFTEMFTCRTDNQRLNPLTAPENHNVLPVIMLNGYGNSAAGASKLLNENTEWYGKEIEYILWGNSDLDKNLVYTDGMIFAIRFALNAIYAFTAQDIQIFANNLATAIAGWTVVGVPIVAACITILIALAESAYDIVLLHDGQDVPIYKTKRTFMCSPVGLASRLGTKVATAAINTAITRASSKVEDALNTAVDDVAEQIKTNADLKLNQCLDKFDDALNKYKERTEESLKDAIKDQFVTPIMNELAPLGTILEISEHYATAEPAELVDGALDKAMRAIIVSVMNMGDSNVKKLCMTILGMSSSDGEDAVETILSSSAVAAIKNKLKTPITSYLQSISSNTGIPTVNIDEVLDGQIELVLEPVATAISDKAQEARDYVSNKIEHASDTAATAAKSEIHNWMDEATTSLTANVTATMNETTGEKSLNLTKEVKDTADDNVSSRVITLNYKEYCKIFMLLFVTFNQDKMLQRAGVMMTANMQTALSKPQPDFDLTKANTMFSVNAQMKMATLFPWPVKDVMNETSPDTGIQLDLSNIRGSVMTVDYCAVNGY